MDTRYPIGQFSTPDVVTADALQTAISEIATLPANLKATLANLSPRQLDHSYRPGGWTARQLAHHLGDSHMNAYVRFKLALTEDTPTVKPYDEALWARLPDCTSASPATSIALIESLHERWVTLLRSLQSADWQRQYLHPELGPQRLDQVAAMYAWHGRHHLAHLALIARSV